MIFVCIQTLIDLSASLCISYLLWKQKYVPVKRELSGNMVIAEINYQLIGAASGWGAQILETECGPQFIKDSGLVNQLRAQGVKVEWGPILYPTQRCSSGSLPLDASRLPLILSHCNEVARAVCLAINEGKFPVIFGGDHAVAIGTWSGVTHALEAWGELGLLWMDAHMDAHTPQTTPSGAYHGMPVASLLGHGLSVLSKILSKKSKIDPVHLVLFGVRSFEAGEKAFLEGLGVRIFYRSEIRERGVGVCLSEALAHVAKAPRGFGVSLDLDMFDPCIAPGVGSPVTDGLLFTDFSDSLELVMSHQKLRALEIVEFNAQLDKEGVTLKLLHNLVLCALSCHKRSQLHLAS